MPQSADQARGVTGQRPPVVAARWLVAAAVPAQVDRDDPGSGQTRQLVAPRPPERAEAVQQHHQRAGRGGEVGLRRLLGLDDVKADPVGVHLRMPPRPVDADDRRRGPRHYPPDESVWAPGPLAAGRLSALWSWEVSASRVSLTDSMVSRGPRMRFTLV